jgi:hypothetical protein
MLNKVFGYLFFLILTFWLSIRSKPSEIQLNDRTFPQNICSQDRIGKIGGGVLIAVKEGLQFTRRSDLERDGVELLVVQLNKANIKPVILYVYYRPPSSSSDGLSLLNNSLLSNQAVLC